MVLLAMKTTPLTFFLRFKRCRVVPHSTFLSLGNRLFVCVLSWQLPRFEAGESCKTPALFKADGHTASRKAEVTYTILYRQDLSKRPKAGSIRQTLSAGPPLMSAAAEDVACLAGKKVTELQAALLQPQRSCLAVQRWPVWQLCPQSLGRLCFVALECDLGSASRPASLQIAPMFRSACNKRLCEDSLCGA